MINLPTTTGKIPNPYVPTSGSQGFTGDVTISSQLAVGTTTVTNDAVVYVKGSGSAQSHILVESTGLESYITFFNSLTGTVLASDGAFFGYSGGLNFYVLNREAGPVHLATSGVVRWTINSSGHLLGGADNTYDIGASGATRPRDIFVANNILAAGRVGVGTASPSGLVHATTTDDNISSIRVDNTSGTAVQTQLASFGVAQVGTMGTVSNHTFIIRTNNTDRWQYSTAGHYLASTDNTFDIGASGATRPRHLYLAGDANIGAVLNHDGSTAGFFAATPAVQQTSGANLTNNVTAGGTDDTIANFTDLVTYANDAAAIRNDIYQLARKLKQVNDGLRTLGLFT